MQLTRAGSFLAPIFCCWGEPIYQRLVPVGPASQDTEPWASQISNGTNRKGIVRWWLAETNQLACISSPVGNRKTQQHARIPRHSFVGTTPQGHTPATNEPRGLASAHACNGDNGAGAEIVSLTLRQACSLEEPGSAMCVQNLDDSRGFAIRITYRISLRSSSLWEPRHPLLKVVLWIAPIIDNEWVTPFPVCG